MSIPPVWMSNLGPRWRSAIAEHSRCQPGKPSPQRGVALVVVDVAAMPGAQLVERVAGEPSIVGKRADRVVDVAVIAHIRVSGIDQPFGQLDHLRYVFRRPREYVGGEDVDEGLIRMKRGLVCVGDLGGCLVLEARGDQHPVLAAIEPLVAHVADVGDVLDVDDLDAVVEERSSDQVRQEERPEVADVGIAIDRRSAGVHRDTPRGTRLEGLVGSGQGVSEAYWHH